MTPLKAIEKRPHARTIRTMRYRSPISEAEPMINTQTENTGSLRYEIRVRGALSDTLFEAFPSLERQVNAGETVLAGNLPDQAALFGVLALIEALGLELLDVRRVPS